MRRALPLLPLIILAMAVPPAGAQATIRRCELPTGQTVYTDRRCDAIGAVERRVGTPQAQLRRYRPTCARSVRDLYFEVSAALESRDANRLAGVYHWPGMSTRAGYDVMQRLQAIVDRGLVDLQPVYPGTGDDAYGSTTRAPVAFGIEQVAANGSTPVRASLGIRRHLDCWWVTLGGGAPRRPAATVAADPDPTAGNASTPAPSASPPGQDDPH